MPKTPEDEQFDFQSPTPGRSPQSPQRSERWSPNRGNYDSRELGWSPGRQIQGTPIGILDEEEQQSPEAGSPGSRTSVDLAVHRPVAQRLEHVAHPVLLPEAMTAVYDQSGDYDGADWEYAYYEEDELRAGTTRQLGDSPFEPAGSPYQESYGGSGSPVRSVGSPDPPYTASESPYNEDYDPQEFDEEQVSAPYRSQQPYTEQEEDGFNYVEPTNIVVSQRRDLNATHYPAPVPAQLKLPPLLSQRNKNCTQLPTRKPRPKSMLKLGVKLESEWGPSPIDHEIAYEGEEIVSDVDSLMVESDASSYATMSDDDSYQHMDGDSDGESVNPRRRRPRKPRPQAKKSSWISGAMYAVIGKGGDQDSKDKELSEDQEDVMDEFDATAFMRYDPDHVREEAKRFQAGGVYSGTRSNGKPTSLIEELEIRKQGRERQRRGIVKDAVSAQQQLATQNKFAHPLDKETQPTLMQLQQVAEVDYTERKRWHQEATVRQKQDRGDESLAARRNRRRTQHFAKSQNVPDNVTPTETLAERRARRKAEKEYRDGLIVQHGSLDDPSSPGREASLIESVAESPLLGQAVETA